MPFLSSVCVVYFFSTTIVGMKDRIFNLKGAFYVDLMQEDFQLCLREFLCWWIGRKQKSTMI